MEEQTGERADVSTWPHSFFSLDVFSLSALSHFDQEKRGVRKFEAKTTLKRQELEDIRWEVESHQEKAKLRKREYSMESQLYLFFKFWHGLTESQEKWRNILFLSPSHPPVYIPKAANIVVQLRQDLYGFICVTMMRKYPFSEMERKCISPLGLGLPVFFPLF